MLIVDSTVDKKMFVHFYDVLAISNCVFSVCTVSLFFYSTHIGITSIDYAVVNKINIF